MSAEISVLLILQLILTDFKERTPALKPLKNHSIVTSGSGTFLNRGLVDQEEVRKQQLNNLIRIVWQTSTTFALQNPQSSRRQTIKNNLATYNKYFIQSILFQSRFLSVSKISLGLDSVTATQLFPGPVLFPNSLCYLFALVDDCETQSLCCCRSKKA